MSFDRAAHQHPLLVQAFQLEQLDLPAATVTDAAAAATSPGGTALGSAHEHLRVRNGIYLGLRPGAVSTLDDSYF